MSAASSSASARSASVYPGRVADERDGSQDLVAHQERHHQVRADAELPERSKVLLATGERDEHLVRHLTDDMRLAGPHHHRRADRVLRVGRPPGRKRARHLLLGRVRVDDCQAAHGPRRLDHVHNGPRSEVRQRQARNGRERRLEVLRRQHQVEELPERHRILRRGAVGAGDPACPDTARVFTLLLVFRHDHPPSALAGLPQVSRSSKPRATAVAHVPLANLKEPVLSSFRSSKGRRVWPTHLFSRGPWSCWS